MAIIHPGIEVFLSDERGRGVRATQNIRAGTCLVKEEPFTFVLLEHERARRCEHCLRKWEKLKVCGGCKDVGYCSNDCQIAAYSSHQYECRFKKKNKHDTLPDWSAARMMIRVICSKLMKKKKQAAHATSSEFPSSVDALCDGPVTLGNAEGAVKCLEEYVGASGLAGWDHASLIRLYTKLYVNSFCLYDEETRTNIGEALYTRSAMFNHNCKPNCVFIYNGKTMEIRSIRDIQSGEECCIHYVQVLQSADVRRQTLFNNYKFWCDCLRCQREAEVQASLDVNQRIKLEEAEVKTKSFVSKIEEEFDENYYQMLETCHEAVAAVKSDLDVIHPSMATLSIKTMEACIALCEWEDAVKSGMMVVEACKAHLLPTDPISGFYMWQVARIQAVEMKQPIAARHMLQQAIDILSIGYGSSHPMTMEAKELLGTIADQ